MRTISTFENPVGSLHCEGEKGVSLLPIFEQSDFEQHLTVDALAEVYKISRRRVFQLAERGVLPRTKDGRYPLRACTARYLEFLLRGDGLERRQRAMGNQPAEKESAKSEWEAVRLERARVALERERDRLKSGEVSGRKVAEIQKEIWSNLSDLRKIAPELKKLSVRQIGQRLDLEILTRLFLADVDFLGEDPEASANPEPAGEKQEAILQTCANAGPHEEQAADLQTSAKTIEAEED